MGRLISFVNVSLDGYFADENGDMSWAHQDPNDAEWRAFVEENASGGATSGGTLLMGRVTYDLMTQYWPTPVAQENDPVVAEQMNNMQKVVFSRTLKDASWNNTRIVDGDIADEVRKLKSETDGGMTILGSGSIVSQLADAGLIDQFQVVVQPVALGSGKSLFGGIKSRLGLKLTSTRTFKNGNVLLCYEPAT